MKHDDDMQWIGETIHTARRRAGFTQEILATEAHVSRRTLVDLEAGRSLPSWRALRAIVRALRLDQATAARLAGFGDAR